MQEIRKFYEAIKNDNDVYVSEIAAALDYVDKQRLMNSEFVFPDFETGMNIPIRKAKFRRPFNLAAVHGSLKVCDVMIHNDVDICLVEIGSYNVIHCLVCVAFYQPYSEEAVVNAYHSLCRMLSSDILRKLLHMEEVYGLRPLEFAAQQGTLRLMSAIFDTPGVYLTREEVVGVSVYQWYDVTEYENCEAPQNRQAMSPLTFIGRLDEKHLIKPCVREVLTNSVIADWISLLKRSAVISSIHFVDFFIVFCT